ncbi:DUF2726 domain-containing protein [Psychrobacter aestuarii]|uniref:DUF2726 domain-containing protein n=1 Tax=Psychrobacter aestuarii TaxID=556327 RepID=A0ABN0VV80_9GAMM|nr:DUF2726 domain-containing protein [Psychrobacter aestuarii]
MEMVVVLGFVVVAIGFIVLLMRRRTHEATIAHTDSDDTPSAAIQDADAQSVWPFVPMPIMTDTEVVFFDRLTQAIPECYIFVQVQLSRMIESDSDTASERNFWFNRICRQSVDYVLVDNDAQRILVAIELDDWTHQSRSREKADAKKDKALASAGIAVMRYHAERMPSVEILRAELLEVIEQL